MELVNEFLSSVAVEFIAAVIFGAAVGGLVVYWRLHKEKAGAAPGTGAAEPVSPPAPAGSPPPVHPHPAPPSGGAQSPAHPHLTHRYSEREHLEAQKNQGDAERYRRLVQHVTDKVPLWKYGTFAPSEGHPRPRIVTVMNFKGGVGKSTISANLAAFFALRGRRRVLAVDLDYQASLSNMLPTHPLASGAPRSSLGDVLSCPKPSDAMLGKICNGIGVMALKQPKTGAEASLHVLPSYLALTELEENEQQRWLLKMTSDDVRSRLRRVLWSEPFAQYDLIILDAPPRLSLSAVAGLVASTHYLVPTRPQILSTQGAIAAIRQISELAAEVGARVELGGIIQNLRSSRGLAAEGRVVEEMMDTLYDAGIRPRLFQATIPDSSAISHPDSTELAYVQRGRNSAAVQEIFDNLGAEVAEALGIQVGADEPAAPSARTSAI